MFDVSWTDPSRETVAQHKSRKEQSSGLSRGSSLRSSRSNDSNPGHRPSLLNLFGGSKKSSTQRNGLGTHKNEHLSQPDKSVHRISGYTTTSDSSLQGPSERATTTRIPVNNFFNGGPPYQEETDNSSPSDGSVFSGWTGRSANTDSSWGSVVDTAKKSVEQPLSPRSFVTQSTEVTVSSSESFQPSEQVATIVHISAAGTMPIQVNASPTKGSPISPISPSTFDFPLPNARLPNTPSKSVLKRDIVLQPSGWPTTARSRQSGSWKPPETWGCLNEDTTPKGTPQLAELPVRTRHRRHSPPTTELTHLQKSIRKMEAASPKIVLERLKEEWMEVADASVYRELELEKQLWMLTALRGLSKKGATGQPPVEPRTRRRTKVLSLFENHASSSFLSALDQAPEIHHLSTHPLSPKLYPNIYPLTIPAPTAQLPYASNIFTSIHAFSLPSILPSSSIPTVLKECHRTLTSSTPSDTPTSPTSLSSSTTTITPTPRTKQPGTLHLTLLDPSPVPASLGPRLRNWLDTHLILHLEKQFRCINPSRLFPVWLSDARLRAEGSTIISVRFNACISSSSMHSESSVSDSNPESKEKEREKEKEKGKGKGKSREELKSIVGRMLWKEIWGGFVEGEKWWWDDEDIVEECERMGTFWEYAVIQAVKQG